ncbi:MAG: hypothetical protein KBC00_00375 [Candidatus Levybacteria bacterium]|nr:hypothetical protein [Candidatus Levybacteria bacterium]MBP9815170.1 hypothetical protein [Candidatus Levybacteria bacterium]
MRESEKSIIGTIETFRQKRPERITHEENSKLGASLRSQVQDLIRQHVAPPQIEEHPQNMDVDTIGPELYLNASIPVQNGEVKLTITADSYPLRLNETEAALTDERLKTEAAERRLRSIDYEISIDDLDHYVVLHGNSPTLVSRLSGAEEHRMRGSYATLQNDSTVGIKGFNKGDYELYSDFLNRLATDPSISFKGNAHNIVEHKHGLKAGNLKTRPAEMG